MKTGVSSISIFCDTSQLFAAAAAELSNGRIVGFLLGWGDGPLSAIPPTRSFVNINDPILNHIRDTQSAKLREYGSGGKDGV